MLKAGYAQEIITPVTGVGLAGYFNERPNEGMYDDLYVKVIAFDLNGKKFGFISFDLCEMAEVFYEEIKGKIIAKFGEELFSNFVICCTHTHTGPEFRQGMNERIDYSLHLATDAGVRAMERALMNLLPAELEGTSVYNNPFAFVRRYWMKNGTIITNPPRCSPDIDKPEDEFDRTINIIAIKQCGRIAALMCNIANHGDTIGGNLVSADWYGRFAQQIQYELKCSLPVMVLDDASGNINHFDVHQKFNQTCYNEATRIGRGYARIVLDALPDLKPIPVDSIVIKNTTVTIPHRVITPEELAAAKHTLATVPDIPKEGDFESQDLANGVPAALRFFAQRVIDCHEKSVKSHVNRLTTLRLGNELEFVAIPGELFNGIGSAIRQASPAKMTFIIELAQSYDFRYFPMPECFERGGYEVQADVDTPAQNAATVIIDAAKSIL